LAIQFSFETSKNNSHPSKEDKGTLAAYKSYELIKFQGTAIIIALKEGLEKDQRQGSYWYFDYRTKTRKIIFHSHDIKCLKPHSTSHSYLLLHWNNNAKTDDVVVIFGTPTRTQIRLRFYLRKQRK
jgi:hypothetical protein